MKIPRKMKDVATGRWVIRMYDAPYEYIRLRVLERDKYKCKKCGASDVRLNVHHKDETGTIPYYQKPNNKMSNLITLCVKCHKSVHTELNRERGRQYLYAA